MISKMEASRRSVATTCLRVSPPACPASNPWIFASSGPTSSGIAASTIGNGIAVTTYLGQSPTLNTAQAG
jgi:hypothetical protein